MAVAPPSIATRTDDATGVVESVGFFRTGADRLFGAVHAPASGASVAVVVCSSLHADFERNYRREVLLGRALAARGVAAVRFHYRGAGHSDGESDDMTLATMEEDADAAAGWVLERTGSERLAFVGTRFGALVAAAAAAKRDAAPLALWEPATDPAAYFREATRARLVRALKEGTGDGSTAETLIADLETTGRLEIIGYGLGRSLYRSAAGRSVEAILADRPRPVLVAQVGRTDRQRAEIAALQRTLDARSFDVEVEAVIGQEPWWFAGERWQPEEDRGVTRSLIETTVAWLTRRLG